MRLGKVDAGFPWGVLLVTDDASTEPIPGWASDEEQVAACATALVVRVMHGQEGDTAVWVWQGSGEWAGAKAFDGSPDAGSGVLRISDALGEGALRLSVEPGQHPVKVYVDDPREASQVHIVLD
jgi:hypothetical protein